MATMGMYVAFVTCLLTCFASQSIDAIHFHFDLRSCDSLLPQTDAVTPGRQNDPNPDLKLSQNAHLVASKDVPHYTIVTSTEHYQRDRLYTVTLEGGGFNGFIIEARQLGSPNLQSEVSGTFTDPPPGVKILQCGTGSSADTAVSTDTSPKESVKLTWKSPSDNLGDIEFVATFVRNYTYWPNVKSAPLTYNDLPNESPEQLPVPAFLQDMDLTLLNCGRTKICYRYSGTSVPCARDECNFVFVSQVDSDFGHVAFTVGGIITERNGYIGVAFTNEKTGSLELFACVKEMKDQFKLKHYAANNIDSKPQEKFQFLQSSELSFGGEHAWCRFRRTMRPPNGILIPDSRMSDFTQPQTMMFLRGPLQRLDGFLLPQLGNSSVFAKHQWNSTSVVDTLVTVAGVSRGEPGMCLTIVSLMVTFFLAAANHK